MVVFIYLAEIKKNAIRFYRIWEKEGWLFLLNLMMEVDYLDKDHHEATWVIILKWIEILINFNHKSLM